MRSFALLALFCSLSLAAVVPRNTVFTNHCCFTLHDVATGATIQENDSNGYLFFGAGQTDGFFCIDFSNPLNQLRDHFYNACFINPTDGAVKCIDPTPGFQSWTLKKVGSNTLLLHDEDSTFNHCPKPSTSAKGTVLYSNNHPSVASCKKTTLKAKNFQGTCNNFAARSEME
ncbi:hypothetical protein ACHAPT_012233 [Fusarium lateritium]